jgi:hypothetical protein
MRVSVFVMVSFVAFVSFVAAPRAQQAAPPTFRTGTRLIVQTVSVKDKDGHAVEDLTAKDFVVVEDGCRRRSRSSNFSACRIVAPRCRCRR